MNNYYYGKSGKGDYRKEDLPKNRWELFMDTLRTRFSGLVRLNLMYMVIWLPTMIVMLLTFVAGYQHLGEVLAAQEGTLRTAIEESADEETASMYTEERIAELEKEDVSMTLQSTIHLTLLILIPCIAITGPATAGVTYVTRNWARDEHAFIWTDFKDAMKENWKQGLVISFITGLIPFVVYLGWRFYGEMAGRQSLMAVPQVLVLVIGILWALCVTYFYPLLVTYRLKMRDVLRNGALLSVARLPMSVGIRLLHCVPALLAFLLAYIWNPIYAALILFAYYLLIGFSLSRFITASYTNAVFDKYLNPRIEGAKINQGLRAESDEDDEDEEDPETHPDPTE